MRAKSITLLGGSRSRHKEGKTKNENATSMGNWNIKNTTKTMTISPEDTTHNIKMEGQNIVQVTSLQRPDSPPTSDIFKVDSYHL